MSETEYVHTVATRVGVMSAGGVKLNEWVRKIMRLKGDEGSSGQASQDNIPVKLPFGYSIYKICHIYNMGRVEVVVRQVEARFERSAYPNSLFTWQVSINLGTTTNRRLCLRVRCIFVTMEFPS